MKQKLPTTGAALDTVQRGRDEVRAILERRDDRLLLLVGPCSIHDPGSALDYAGRLAGLRAKFSDRLCLLMRAYFEKPRTVLGWKGMINDPNLDGSCDMETGYKRARSTLLAIVHQGLPAATEFLEPLTPQYIADLVSWASVGARTAESQAHREMASGLAMPTGFKNNTDGNVRISVSAVVAARTPHTFPGIDEQGRVCICRTTGNPWCHLVMRGGTRGPNHDAVSLRYATRHLEEAGLPPVLLVDCSHGNSGYQHQKQPEVFQAVIQQRLEGNRSIVGLMLESHLLEGKQSLVRDGELRSGVSVTDACIGWDTTEKLLGWAYEALG